MKTNKMMYVLMVSLSVAMFTLVLVPTGYAADADAAKKSVAQYLKDKTKISGSLDKFDSKADKVRNLKLIKIHKDTFKSSGDAMSINADFRDLQSGDILDVIINLEEDGGDLAVANIKIGDVKKMAKEEDPEAAKKKFTDEEAQAAMQAYIDKMSRFGGTFGLFDEKNEKYRQLKLLKMDEKVRNFGVLYISTIHFEDAETQEKLTVDMTVHNKKGKLEVKTVRIKKIVKPKK